MREKKPSPPTDAEREATRRGVAARLTAAEAAQAVRQRELRTMTHAEALAAADALLDLLPGLPPKDVDYGLVEQQRRFARLRE